MQRIAVISEHASPLALLGGTDSGGQNVYVGNLARELARLGYLVDIFTRSDQPGQTPLVEWLPGVRVVHVIAGPQRFLPKEQLLPYMPEFSRYMLGFIREQQICYDIVHANFFMSGMVALQLKRLISLPFVITFHALGRVRRQSQGQADGFPDVRFSIEEQLMCEADMVIAECEQDERDMRELYDCASARIAVVPCGFDPDEFWPVRETARTQLGLSASEFIVLQLGRMVPRKGIANVIRALCLLQSQHQVVARLLVVGGETADANPLATPEIGRLAGLASSLGMAHRVQFTGRQPRVKLRQYYSAANVFVTTPWYEPFGITPLEAMACATPVIGSAVGGIQTTVQDGQTGFLVPPDDPAALAEKLALLQRDPQLAEQLGWSGLRRAHRHFTWRRVAIQVASVYRLVLQGGPASPNMPASSATEQPARLVQ